MIGKKFSRLTVIKQFFHPYNSSFSVEVLCECGNKKRLIYSDLSNGKVKSCGCLEKENQKLIGSRTRTHGLRKTFEYATWAHLIQRCSNSKDKSFKNYGARGITYCKSWSSFECFISDMGPAPSKKHTIERVNNDLGYSKENCIWALRSVQSRNTRRNLNFTIDGKTLCLKDWCNIYKMKYDTVRYRVKHGVSIIDALELNKG